jgi:O-succinylbenzoic acid--CoA ligase
VALLPETGSQVAAQRAAVALGEPIEHEGIAAIITTSGSSGDPLAVLLPAAALTAAAQASHAWLPEGAGRWLVAMPVTAVGGLMTLVRAIDAGLEPVYWSGVGGGESFSAQSFLPAATEAINRSLADGAPTYVSLVPTQLARLIDSGGPALESLAQFSYVLIGAAALPTVLRQKAQAAGIRLTSTYGATETCGGVVYDGIPLGGVSVRTDPDVEGQVIFGGPTIAAGYQANSELTSRSFINGTFHTSDVGRIDNGVLTVLGRTDDVIKVGGSKVSLNAIADVVRGLDGIDDVAVIAIADDEWGQRPVALVVGEIDGVVSAVDESIGRTRLEVRRLDSLPYLPNGKIDRMTLRRDLEEG